MREDRVGEKVPCREYTGEEAREDDEEDGSSVNWKKD
jgi:hypothetical protein